MAAEKGEVEVVRELHGMGASVETLSELGFDGTTPHCSHYYLLSTTCYILFLFLCTLIYSMTRTYGMIHFFLQSYNREPYSMIAPYSELAVSGIVRTVPYDTGYAVRYWMNKKNTKHKYFHSLV